MNVQAENRMDLENHILKYASSDLVCYFASSPKELVEIQKKHWLPLLKWIKDEYNINLKTVSKIKHKEQSKESIKNISNILQSMEFDDLRNLYILSSITGSFVISFALIRDKIDIEVAHEAAFLDELYQLDRWGEDSSARKRLDSIKVDMAKALGFFSTSS